MCQVQIVAQHGDVLRMLQGFNALLGGLSLKTLGLRFCELDHLPFAVSAHTSLRRLVIRDCSLSYLPKLPKTTWSACSTWTCAAIASVKCRRRLWQHGACKR